MSRPDRQLTFAECFVEKIGGLQRNLQQRTLPCGLVVSNRRFIQMSEVVELVAVYLFKLPPLRSGPRMRLLRIDAARRIQIAVLLLCCGDLFDQTVDVSLNLRIRMNGQRIGGTFDDFVDVSVVERIARQLLVARSDPGKRGGSAFEVLETTAFFTLL